MLWPLYPTILWQTLMTTGKCLCPFSRFTSHTKNSACGPAGEGPAATPEALLCHLQARATSSAMAQRLQMIADSVAVAADDPVLALPTLSSWATPKAEHRPAWHFHRRVRSLQP